MAPAVFSPSRRFLAAAFLLLAASLRADAPVPGTLLRETRMDLRSGERVVGFLTLPKGAKVTVLGTDGAGGYLIRRIDGEASFAVPHDAVEVMTAAAGPAPAPMPAVSPQAASPQPGLTKATPSPTPVATPSPSAPPSLPEPTAAAVNKALGIPLFGTVSLWEENDAMVANRLRWPQESKTASEAGYRRYPYTFNTETRVFGVRALSLFLQGTGDKVSRVSILFANKGDIAFYMSPDEAARQKPDQPLNVTDSMLRGFQEAMRVEKSTLQSALKALFGDARPVSLGRFQSTREEAQRWDWKGHAFLLVHQANEYLMLRIVPTAELDDADSPKKAFSAAKASLASRVEKRANGDVLIGDFPMVDQGRKGYCVPATFERLLRYYGLPADMNLLAMAGQTRAGGGTSIDRIQGAVRNLVADAGGSINACNFSGSIQQIKPFLDAGKPLLFAHYSTQEFNKRVDERMARRIAVTNWDDWATRFLPSLKKGPPLKPDPLYGHVCLIIGYNEKTREIAITDSWGPAATERWMTEEEARQIMQPTGLSVIE